jgi:hypothetical protein
MTTPSRAALRGGLVLDVEVGETLTLHPSPEMRTIVIRVLEKHGRKAKLRVQSHEAVRVSTQQDKNSVPAG